MLAFSGMFGSGVVRLALVFRVFTATGFTFSEVL
jgi:hypothetical protein